jgi:DNA (cytosine-5)-methyltransferase 1
MTIRAAPTLPLDDPVLAASVAPGSGLRGVAEFFAGIGLVRLALERRGWSFAFANDIDASKLRLYRDNFDTHGFVLGDVHSLSGEDVPSVGLATASFPCNDLSLAGRGRGLDGDNSGTFWAFVRILGEMGSRRPPLLLIENVMCFLIADGGTNLARALMALNDLGYATDAFVVDAAHFVPQSRRRLFVVGVSGCEAQDRQRTRALSSLDSGTRPKALRDFVAAHPDIDWCVRQLPPLPRRTAQLPDVLENLPDDAPEWWSQDRVDYLLNQMSERHLATARAMMQSSTFSYGTVFRRVRNGRSMGELRVDGLAGCLRTPRGGSGRQILFKAGGGRAYARLLTPRECARLMGVPDTYQIKSPLNEALFGFGDAVCVPAVEWIESNYLAPLADELMRSPQL